MMNRAPPTPAKTAEMMNAISLYRNTFSPTNETRCSFSPSAEKINPYGDLMIRFAAQIANRATTATKTYRQV